MTLQIENIDQRIADAVSFFWNSRSENGVRSGQTLDGFTELLQGVVRCNGLPNAQFIKGRQAQLPGFFRPTKSWDLVVIDNGKLVAAIELKSIADSFGKNSNNRNEEALGSGIDLKEAITENAFSGSIVNSPFIGYLILVEDCLETTSSVEIQMRYFKAMSQFLINLNSYNEVPQSSTYPAVQGISYLQRFDILCKNLMQKQLYSQASVIKSVRNTNTFSQVSAETSIYQLITGLAAQAQRVSTNSRFL